MKVALTYGEGIFATGVKRYADAIVPELVAAGVDAQRVPLRRRELRLRGRVYGGYLSVWAGRYAGRPRGYDIVHALDPSVAARGTDVVTVHDLVVEMFPEWYQTTFAARMDQRILRRVARRARWFVADTEATRQELIARWRVDPERVRVVHLGIDAARFRPTDAPAPLASGGKPTLVLVGDDNPRKNVQLAIEAAAALRGAHGIDARVVRVGSSKWPDVRARYQRAAEEAKVELVEPGSLDDAELVPLLARADALLWPSLAEGFGFPPLEAMACGTPVVALDTPVNREVCGPLASYHANEAPAAAEAIARALAHPPSQEALVAYAGQFTWQRAAERTRAVYEEARR